MLNGSVTGSAGLSQQVPFHFPAHKPIDFDSFIGTGNIFPVHLLRELVWKDAAKTIYLWGQSGCGKTHLLQAACNAVHDRGQRTMYIDCADYDTLEPSLLDGLERLDLVCLDALHRLAGVAHWERAVMGLFEALRQQGKCLLLAALSQPQHLPISLPDLRTRLSWDLVCHIKSLNDEEKAQAIAQRARMCALELPKTVIDYLLQRVSRDPHTLFSLLARLDTASMAQQRRVTIPFVRQVLATKTGE